ncbi:hypothetical protein BH24DEI2_BH24DEI2_12860 [soil metagenome]
MADKNYRLTLSASSLIDDKVKNSQDENIGDLKELMIDVQSGRVAYGVLDFGGILGMGNKLFAVPWQAFSVDEENKILRLDVDKDRLKNAEGFDLSSWPDTADTEWGQKIHDYYGYTPHWD